MKNKTLKRMISYITKYKALLFAAFASAALYVPLALLGPVFIGEAIDAFSAEGGVDMQAVVQNLVWLGATAASAALLQWIMQVCTRKISAMAAKEMRRQAFERIHAAPLKKLSEHPQGDLTNRLINDADAVSEGFLQAITQLLPGVVTIITTILLMLMLNVGIALIVIIATPLSVLFARIVTRRTGKLFITQSAQQGKMSSVASEMVKNKDVVNAFGAEQIALDEFEDASEGYQKANFLAILYSSIINPGARFVNAVVYAAVGTFGAISAIMGGITIGQISAFLAYANQYTKPFNDVTAVLTQLQSAFAGAQRMFEVMDWPSEAADAPDAKGEMTADGRVQMSDVCFSYDEKRPLIQGFNLSTHKGQRIALVGATGSGKTTVISLLMRFYELNGGSISVDDVPILDIKRNTLRGMYGMVLQETWLKAASVHENIAYARPSATRKEVEEAARAAYAHSFIMRLPNGYDTPLKTDGGNLSAGQKQLLCIARIMLAKPQMLILDEATSNIDTRTEMLIQKALKNLMQGHTSFIVAHRLSTIKSADVILVMQHGRIVERGNHEELLAQNGMYAGLYNSRFAGEGVV